MERVFIFMSKYLCSLNVKLKLKFTIEQATKAQGGGLKVQLYSFFNLGAGRGVGGQLHALADLTFKNRASYI